MLRMRASHHLDCCSLNSSTLVPSEDALSHVPEGTGQLGRGGSPSAGWDAASEGHTHRAAAARLQVQREECGESARVTQTAEPSGTQRALSLPQSPKEKLSRAGLRVSCSHRTRQPRVTGASLESDGFLVTGCYFL